MVRRRALGALAVAGGALAGWVAERRAAAGLQPVSDPEWAELAEPISGEPCPVTSFDGTRLHAEVVGPASAPVIVLVHGYALGQHSWHYQRRDLADTLRVVSYDQRGHGASGPAAGGDYSIHALGRDLAAVLEATVPRGQRALVAGHSMGGMSLLAYAEQFPEQIPERLAGAAILSSTASDVIAGGAFGVARGLATAASALLPRVVARRWPPPGRASDLGSLVTRALGFGPGANPAQVAFIEQLVLSCPSSVRAAVLPAVTGVELRDAVKHLQVPTLVLVGARDRLAPPAQSRRLAEALPAATLVELEGIGHVPMLEAHEEVTAHLRLLAARTLEEAA